MSFLQPVQCSRAWYDFVSEKALKDEEVLRLAGDYIDAMNKLNTKLAALANDHPTLQSFSVQSPGAEAGNAPVAPDFVQSVQEFHAFHGVSYSEEEIIADARRHGLATVAVSE